MSLHDIKTPKYITPCPIEEAALELRFQPNLPVDIILGMVFKGLEGYSNLTKLPILQLPEFIRESDPNLIYSPYYKLEKDSFVLQIGPRILSFVCLRDYVGWENFYGEFTRILKVYSDLNIFDHIEKIGLRYIDFFPEVNVFEKINIKLSYDETIFSKGSRFLKQEFTKDDFSIAISITDSAKFNDQTGSMIDIDVMNNNVASMDDIKGSLEKAHDYEKIFFFSLLEQSFLNSLNPTYEKG